VSIGTVGVSLLLQRDRRCPIGPNEVIQIVTFQQKAGGWLAVGCALLGGLIQWLRMPLLQCPGLYETDLITGERVCSTAKTVDPLALGTISVAVIIGGCIGVVIALILIRLGVSHDTLGADPDA
jgi:hypothetical protein